ncbi:MAG: hypothetical protein AB7F89_02205 [Pirellulaceae bacterium]
MARLFRLWVKKRGDRRTGSRLAGGLGEAVFFGLMFLLGSASLAGLITDQVLHAGASFVSPGFGFWVLVLALSSFILIGGGGVVYTVMHVGTSAERRSALARQAAKINPLQDFRSLRDAFPHIPVGENLINSPGVTLAYRLPVAQSPAGRLFAAMVLFLVLTGITSVLGMIAVQEHLAARPDWFLTLFVLVLIALDAWATRLFLRLLWQHTRIGPTCVEISHHPLRPGEEYAIFLSQYGRVSLAFLRMSLVCEEEATYQQGTDIRTESQTVHEQVVFSRGPVRIEPAVPFEQKVTLRIPSHAMHSFQSGHNAVRWRIVVKAEPEKWPMFVRSFPVLVHPADGST